MRRRGAWWSSVVVMGGMRPVPPNIVYCGMMQCREARPLNGDLKQFMDSATEGVLYVSFGSVLQGSQVPTDKKEALLKAFGSLKQKVLMKWESDDMEGKPDNMMVRKFLPQQVVKANQSNLRQFDNPGYFGTSQHSCVCDPCRISEFRGVSVSPSPYGGHPHLL